MFPGGHGAWRGRSEWILPTGYWGHHKPGNQPVQPLTSAVGAVRRRAAPASSTRLSGGAAAAPGVGPGSPTPLQQGRICFGKLQPLAGMGRGATPQINQSLRSGQSHPKCHTDRHPPASVNQRKKTWCLLAISIPLHSSPPPTRHGPSLLTELKSHLRIC